MFTRRDDSPFVPSVRSAARLPVPALGLAVALFFSVGLPGFARAADTSFDKSTMTYSQFAKMEPMAAMKMMDPDNKGYVTREEFLRLQAKLFDNIPKQNRDRVTMQEWRSQAENAGK
jgi:hypothetical protein